MSRILVAPGSQQAVLEAVLTAGKVRQQAPPRKRYPDDPVGFIKERLGEFIWSKQVEIAEVVIDHRRGAV